MSDKSNRINKIGWLQSAIVPSPSPLPVSHGGAESGYAGRNRAERAGSRYGWMTERADDTVDGSTGQAA